MKHLDNVVLILSDARGIYIPRDFLTDNYNEIAEAHCSAWHLTEENKDHWLDAINPDSDWYWEAWEWVLDNAYFIEEKTGKKYTLYQDGNLWGICYDAMTDEEKQNFGFED